MGDTTPRRGARWRFTIAAVSVLLLGVGDLHTPAHAAPATITNLTLTVTPSSGPAGVAAIPTAGVDAGALPVGLESAPLRSSPLRSSPLRSSPLRSSPLRSSPLRSSPLRSSPLRSSPLRSSPIQSAQLPPMPLSAVPLLLDGGWEPWLVGTPKEGLPLTSVLLQDVIGYPQLSSLTLADIDISSTPLWSSPIQAFLLAGPTLDQLSASTDWCREVASPTFSCASKGISVSVATLLDLVTAGAAPTDLDFVRTLLVKDAHLTGSVIAGYDVASVEVAGTSLGGLAVASLPSGIVDCSRLPNCATATLAEAVARNAIYDSPTAVLGPILADPALVGSMNFGELIRAVVDPAKLDYAGLPLPALLAQAPLGPTGAVAYTAEADVDCAAGSDLSVSVHLPAGFRYVPGSATQSIQGSGPVSAGDPAVLPPAVSVFPLPPGTPTGPNLSWPVSGADCASRPGVNHVTHRFLAQPGVTLGLHASDVAMVSPLATAGRTGVAPVQVGEAFEPNDTAASATPVDPGVLYLSHISAADDVDFFALPPGLPAGTRVSAVLSHLPTDFDLLLDGPVAAPLRSSPLRSSPLRSSPIEDFGLTGDRGGEVIEPDTLQDVPLRSSVLSHSAAGSFEDEQVTTILTAASTAGSPVTFEVTNHLGTASGEPYMLQVFTDPPPELHCPDGFVLGEGGGEPGALPVLTPDDEVNGRTLYLMNQQRLGDLYSGAMAAKVRTELDALAAQPGESRGVVVPVEGDLGVADAYREWDRHRCSPDAANKVVRAIGQVVDRFAARMPDLRYITFVGDDDVVPFARIPDGTMISNQRDYTPKVTFAGVDNPISAAFAYGYLLSDNVLTAKQGIDFLGHQLLIPDYAGGRLVETADEILQAITQYRTQPFITLDRALTTGYDFLADVATALDTTFARAQSTRDVLIREDWSRQDLIDALNVNRPTIAAVNAHFDHSNSLPAIGNKVQSATAELFSTDDLLQTALPPGAYLFTLGCEAGLNVPGRAWLSAPPAQQGRLLDFAQALAQMQAGGLFGNTGYGYGDSVEIAYSERLLDLFAANLDGSMTVAQAAAKAKRDYLATGLVSVYDEKVLNEATSYGMPFVTVGPTGVGAPPPAPTPGTLSDTFLGIQVHPFTANETYTLRTTDRGIYYTVGSQPPLVEPYRPIQPADVQHLPNPPAGTQLGDVLFTGLVSLPDVFLPNPVFSMPTVDQKAFSPEPLVRSVNFPASIGTVSPVGTLGLFPGEYRSASAPGTGTQLRFKSMEGKVFYPTSSDAARPQFRAVTATATSTGVQFRVEVGPSTYTSVLYRATTPDVDGNFVWGQLDLAETSPGVWTATLPAGDVAEYLVQAVKDGRVGTTRAKGVDYVPTPEANVTVTGTQGDDGWYTGVPTPVTVDVAATGQTFTATVDGGGVQSVPVTLTADGIRHVGYTGSNGATGLVVVPVDASAPEVHFVQPAAGGSYVVGSAVTAAFTCSDPHAGVKTCEALDPLTLDTSPGSHTFRVHVTDNAGNDAVRTVTYTATYTFEGFFSPVDNPDIWNTASAGKTIPVKFRLRVAGGTVVTDTGVVNQPVQSAPVACDSGSTDRIEVYAPADATSGLRFDTTNQQFVYSWKTQRAWANTCRKLVVSFDDGSSYVALFQFTR